MTGMRMTFIEAPMDLQKMHIQIPNDHRAICKKQSIRTSGNCAGDTAKALDTSGCANKETELDTWGYARRLSVNHSVRLTDMKLGH
jgi:hypothetical protein